MTHHRIVIGGIIERDPTNLEIQFSHLSRYTHHQMNTFDAIES